MKSHLYFKCNQDKNLLKTINFFMIYNLVEYDSMEIRRFTIYYWKLLGLSLVYSILDIVYKSKWS